MDAVKEGRVSSFPTNINSAVNYTVAKTDCFRTCRTKMHSQRITTLI